MPSTECPQILVVEDDPGSRRAMRNILEDSGYAVSAVGTVGEALHALRQAPAALIVLDLMLPDMEGWDFRARQRKTQPSRRFPSSGCPRSASRSTTISFSRPSRSTSVPHAGTTERYSFTSLVSCSSVFSRTAAIVSRSVSFASASTLGWAEWTATSRRLQS